MPVFPLILMLALFVAPRSSLAAAFDLQRWNPEKGMTTIEGDWDIVWNQLYTPEEFAQNRAAAGRETFPIPGVWKKTGGYATYRSLIRLPGNIVQGKIPLTFELMNTPGAFKLWVDGVAAIESGKVGRNRKKEVPSNGSSYYTFIPDKTEIELVLQVSSFHHRDGGTWWPIKIGTAENVSRIRAAGVGVDGFALSCLFIMTFYHFGLWLMRREYRAALAFAVFCLVVAMRASVTGLGDIHRLIYPGMPYSLQKVLEYASFYLGLPAYYAFVRALYPEDLKLWMERGLWIMGGLFALTTVLLPVAVFTDFIESYQAITMIAILMFCFQLSRTVRMKRDGIALLLLGSAILIFSSINDILHAHRHGPIPMMVFPYGLFLMILCQAILLARRFSRAFHEVEVNERQIQSLNAELQNQNVILDQLVEEKTRDIRSIMKNIKQGIFTITGEGTRIGSEFSDHLRSIIGVPHLKGGEPYGTIFAQADLSADIRDQMTAVLNNVVGEDSLAFDVNAHLLPREMRFLRGFEKRTLEVDWSAIENEHSGQTEKVLVSLRDVTDLRQLQQESQRNQEELQLIGEVLNVAQDKFDGVIQSCRSFLADCGRQLQREVMDPHLLFRAMHTLKGIARSYGLRRLADAAHDCEALFARLREGENLQKAILKEAVARVEQLLERYDQLHRHKLGRQSAGPDMLLVDRAVIAENMASLQTLDLSDLSHEVQHRVEHLSRLFMNMVYMPLPKLLHELIEDLPQLARDLGKENPELIFHDPGLSIRHEAHELFRNTFTHLFRNSLDHGLEPAAVRQKQGKGARGCIEIELRLSESGLEIFVGDDGRGLDLAAIGQRAQQRGLIASRANLSDYELANLIFAPGLSTKDQVTSVSGRGVGLDAVKNFIDQHNGDIDIQLGTASVHQTGVPFRFHITLPASVCEWMRAVA